MEHNVIVGNTTVRNREVSVQISASNFAILAVGFWGFVQCLRDVASNCVTNASLLSQSK
jgi:hypothetical protein